MSLDFLLTALVIILLPGTGVLYTLAVSVQQGFRAGSLAAFGCTLGIVPHIAASILGLSALFHASAEAFTLLRYAGVAYLLYMAFAVLSAGGGSSGAADGAPTAPLRIVATAILLNLLNPKLTLFFLAFLPQFVTPGTPSPLRALLLLAGAFMALTFLVFCLYGLLASLARHHMLSRPAILAWLRRSFAVAFALMGLRLALDQRPL